MSCCVELNECKTNFYQAVKYPVIWSRRERERVVKESEIVKLLESRIHISSSVYTDSACQILLYASPKTFEYSPSIFISWDILQMRYSRLFSTACDYPVTTSPWCIIAYCGIRRCAQRRWRWHKIHCNRHTRCAIYHDWHLHVKCTQSWHSHCGKAQHMFEIEMKQTNTKAYCLEGRAPTGVGLHAWSMFDVSTCNTRTPSCSHTDTTIGLVPQKNGWNRVYRS